MQQFLRVIAFLGEDKFQQLQNKKVTVIGLGAVGSFAVEALVRSGVRRLRLVDFDRVSETNLNRQIFALHSTVGQYKTEVARARVLDINPDLELEIFTEKAQEDTYSKLLANQPDIVLDAIDSLSAKVGLLSYCYRHGIPVVSSMGAAMKSKPELIQTSDISKTSVCGLARAVRQGLKKNEIYKGIPCVFSTEKVDRNVERLNQLGELDAEYQASSKQQLLGSLGTLTGMFGLRLAKLALDKLLD